MLYPPDFDKRAVEIARRATDDIVECDRADVSVIHEESAPMIRFIFAEDLRARFISAPAFFIELVAHSRKNPLAPGRLLEGDEIRRRVRESVEQYLKMNGIEVTRRKVENACL